MRQSLPAKLLGRAEADPAALSELAEGVLEAGRRRHRGVVVARAALVVTRLVEREEHLGAELAALFEDRVYHVRRGGFEARQVGIGVEPQHVIEHEARIGDRRRIGRHPLAPYALSVESAAFTCSTKPFSSSIAESMSSRWRRSWSMRDSHFSTVTRRCTWRSSPTS